MKKIIVILLLIAAALSVIIAGFCHASKPNSSAPVTYTTRGIYYWRTTFNVSDQEQTFLTRHKVQRLYLHLFDVEVTQRNFWENTAPQPVATILFKDDDNLQSTMSCVKECIPTIFITLDALKMMSGQETDYAQKITQRILNMCSYHGFAHKVHEVQIDYDWTPNTEYSYFKMLDQIRSMLHERNIQLSATIRLHQLRTDVPPVDKGVLMVYNTCSIRQPETTNSILSCDNAAPYLRYFRYSLPLDYAFPTFGWGVWFRDNKFMAILHCTNYLDPFLFKQIDGTHYQVVTNCEIEGHLLKRGDIIRLETSDMATIEQVKQLLPFDKGQTIILYHLDENNLKNYSDNEIETLYTHPCAL